MYQNLRWFQKELIFHLSLHIAVRWTQKNHQPLQRNWLIVFSASEDCYLMQKTPLFDHWYTLWAMSLSVSSLDIFSIIGTNSSFFDNGRTEHLYGAIIGGKARYVLCSSPSRWQKLKWKILILTFISPKIIIIPVSVLDSISHRKLCIPVLKKSIHNTTNSEGRFYDRRNKFFDMHYLFRFSYRDHWFINLECFGPLFHIWICNMKFELNIEIQFISNTCLRI